MKKALQFVLGVALVMSLCAAVDAPANGGGSDIAPVMAGGPAPMPLCPPGDRTCDPGIPFPRPTSPQVAAR